MGELISKSFLTSLCQHCGEFHKFCFAPIFRLPDFHHAPFTMGFPIRWPTPCQARGYGLGWAVHIPRYQHDSQAWFLKAVSHLRCSCCGRSVAVPSDLHPFGVGKAGRFNKVGRRGSQSLRASLNESPAQCLSEAPALRTTTRLELGTAGSMRTPIRQCWPPSFDW